MPRKLADGSVSGQRMQSAYVRAIDGQMGLQRMIDKLSDELDQITLTGRSGIPVELDEGDSLVTVVDAAIMAASANGAKR